MDPLMSPWLIVVASVIAGAGIGVVFERTRGTAAKRAAKFEADLVQARSELMRYQEQTKHHFGKSAELLGRMATNYREFLDHFVSGAEALCGPNMKEINASGLDRPMLERSTAATAGEAMSATATAPTVATVAAATAAPRDTARGAASAAQTAMPACGTTRPANGAAHGDPLPPSALGSVHYEPLAEDVAK